MTLAPRIILALSLCAATAIFAGCATHDRSQAEHAAHSTRTAPNPCAGKTATSTSPCGEKAANPCNPGEEKAGRADGTFDPWSEEDQPSNKEQSTDTADSWW
jgi:hypothetical protein